MTPYTIAEFWSDIDQLAEKIPAGKYSFIYGIPRGGVPVAMALSQKLRVPMIGGNGDFGQDGILYVDDIVDTGRTAARFHGDVAAIHQSNRFPKEKAPTYYVKESTDWIRYWWECDPPIEESIVRILEYIGENPKRAGLKETPSRVIRSYGEIFSGYKIDPASVFKTYDAETYDQIVLLRDIELYSTCEHHLLPFFGKAHIAYIPRKRLIGLSKLARLLEIHSRRLQVQERIGEQVTQMLMKHLDPVGAACIIEARHLCVCARGVNKENSTMVTASLKGVFFADSKKGRASRSELMGLIK